MTGADYKTRHEFDVQRPNRYELKAPSRIWDRAVTDA